MASNDPDPDRRDETTHERPSSFREVLLRDRRLLSRRQMERRLRDRAVERENGRSESESQTDEATYFPALSRLLSGGTGVEARALVIVIVLTLTAFLFGRWVGQQGTPEPTPQPSAVVLVV